MSKEKFSIKDDAARRLRENGESENGMVWLDAKSAQAILDAVLEKHPEADIAINEEHFVVVAASGEKVYIPRWSHVPIANEDRTKVKNVAVEERIKAALGNKE
jgi:hypothetical protein